jgi:hypothetical protein
MPLDAGPMPADPRPERAPDARIARIHLRTGLYPLARAELETLAGRGALDAPALVDLAEVRWRTGDLVGAGEAARACIEAGLTETVVLCIAAEAAAAVGRVNDAREYAARAVAAEADQLDELFAGQPRSSFWPPPRLPQPPGASHPAPPHAAVTDVPMVPPVQAGATPGPEAAAVPPAIVLAGPSPDRDAPSSAAADLVDTQALVARGEVAGLSVRLQMILREQPILAPAVLGVADEALALGLNAHERASIHLVRADAYRLMGRETLSREAYQQASRDLRGPQQPQESP